MRYHAILLLALVGCSQGKSAPPAGPAAAAVAQADFQHLSYLAGSWRGQPVSGNPFFERYVPLNDSTINSFTFADSTFQAATDSGQIRWSNGQVRSGSSPSDWIATGWTADSVRFERADGTGNAFVWIRRSTDAWEARLTSPRSPSATIYQMTRLSQ